MKSYFVKLWILVCILSLSRTTYVRRGRDAAGAGSSTIALSPLGLRFRGTGAAAAGGVATDTEAAATLAAVRDGGLNEFCRLIAAT
mmetsp:Transcript_20667/g.47751  ORF Transcript_20667/g.47751 Transcript_20667/m.47751 type:complete len:86 (+) Transcript_20667:751-1008(+)